MAGSGLTLLLIAGLTFRWRIFLRQQEIDIPYRTIFLLTWAGQFFNSILPGSTGGDLVKIYQVCRFTPHRKAAAVGTVLIDRISALFALATLALVAIAIDPKPLRLLPTFPASKSTAVFRVALVAALGLLAFGSTIWLARGTNIYGRIVRTLAAARGNLALDGRLLSALLLAFGIHLLNFLTIYFFARALQIPITFGQVLLMMPVILFFLLTPITINGHGLRELLLVGYFSYFGIGVSGHSDVSFQDAAVALSLVAVANDLLWSVPGGIGYLVSFKRRAGSAVTDCNALEAASSARR